MRRAVETPVQRVAEFPLVTVSCAAYIAVALCMMCFLCLMRTMICTHATRSNTVLCACIEYTAILPTYMHALGDGAASLCLLVIVATVFGLRGDSVPASAYGGGGFTYAPATGDGAEGLCLFEAVAAALDLSRDHSVRSTAIGVTLLRSCSCRTFWAAG